MLDVGISSKSFNTSSVRLACKGKDLGWETFNFIGLTE